MVAIMVQKPRVKLVLLVLDTVVILVVQTLLDATKDEMNAIYDLLIEARSYLDKKFRPDGYNIGINIGEAAGQTIMHMHIHMIPRYGGDIENPKGGVRGVIPEMRIY